MEEGLHNSKVLLKAKFICSLYRLHVGYFFYSFSPFYVHGEHHDMLEAGLGPYLEDLLFHLFSIEYLFCQPRCPTRDPGVPDTITCLQVINEHWLQ